MKDLYQNVACSNKALRKFTMLLSLMLFACSMQTWAQTASSTTPSDPINVAYTAGSQNVTVNTCTGSGTWTISQLSGSSWAHLSTTPPLNSGTAFTVNYDENLTSNNRTAVFQITATSGCPDDPIVLSIIQSKEGIAPTIRKISTSHANGSFKSGEQIDIDVYYYDYNTINLTGTNLSTNFYLNLNNGGKAYWNSDAGYSAGIKKITFRYTVATTGEDVSLLNVTSVNISGNVAIKDAANNTADQTLPVTTPPDEGNLGDNNALRIDNILPNIASVTSSPSGSGTLKIGDNLTFTAAFSGGNVEPVGTVTSDTYNGHTLVWSTSNGGTTWSAVYGVTENDADQLTPIQVTNVHMVDGAGNSGNTMSGSDVAHPIDAHKPTGNFVPNNGATGVAVDGTITLTFNEAVFTVTGSALTSSDLQSITLTRSSPSGQVLFTASIDGTNKIITITPATNLLGSASYTVSMGAGQVFDAAHNPNAATSSTFSTSTGPFNVTGTRFWASY